MSTERVRAYLLGLLSDSEAAEVEERYFADAGYLRLVEAKESQLISEYLDGRLPPSEKELFEKRYREVPLLKAKVEVVRRERKASASRFRWRALAAATATVVVVVSAWIYLRPHTPAQTVARQQRAPSTPVIGLFLAPGLQRGVDTIATVTAPPNTSVKLSLELPGVHTPQQYVARIHRVGSDTDAPPVWTSPTSLLSQPSATGQVAEFVVAGALLSPDDYIVELRAVNGETAERYVFRLVR
jgi:hypothetical protein